MLWGCGAPRCPNRHGGAAPVQLRCLRLAPRRTPFPASTRKCLTLTPSQLQTPQTPAKPETPANGADKPETPANGTAKSASAGASGGRDTTGAKAFKRVNDEEWLGKKGSMSNHYEDTFGQRCGR
jgi:hypothetical protein